MRDDGEAGWQEVQLLSNLDKYLTVRQSTVKFSRLTLLLFSQATKQILLFYLVNLILHNTLYVACHLSCQGLK